MSSTQRSWTILFKMTLIPLFSITLPCFILLLNTYHYQIAYIYLLSISPLRRKLHKNTKSCSPLHHQSLQEHHRTCAQWSQWCHCKYRRLYQMARQTIFALCVLSCYFIKWVISTVHRISTTYITFS